MTDSQDSTALMVEVVISTVILIMNIFGNSLILLVIKHSKYFKHVTCHLVAHVAVADIIFGCSVVLKMIITLGLLDSTLDICFPILILQQVTSACSGFGICLILVENYLSVRHLSSSGGTNMTLCKAQMSIVSFWVMYVILQLVPVYVMSQPEVPVSSSSCKVAGMAMLITEMITIILILTTMVFLMISITLIVRKSLKNLFQGESTAADLLKQRSMKKKAKLATLFTIIAAGFIISWAPLIVSMAVAVICPVCVPSGTVDLLGSFVQLNSCVNFMVYAIKDKSFKNVCMGLLKCKRNEVAPLSSTGTQ